MAWRVLKNGADLTSAKEIEGMADEANMDDGATVEVALLVPGMEVRSSNGLPLGVLAQLVGLRTLKLRQDPSGLYHYIPLGWVKRIDGAVCLDRTVEQAMREWATVPPRR